MVCFRCDMFILSHTQNYLQIKSIFIETNQNTNFNKDTDLIKD